MSKPNLTPKQIFQKGAFGGTYWRPIKSGVTKKSYKDQHLEFPKSWWKNIEVTNPRCNKQLNRYKVKSGTSLKYWEEKGWIKAQDPYGWVQWYCRYYQGRRSKDDDRQIKRWEAIAGENGRFRNRLIKMCYEKGAKYNDETVSPVIRQLLLQWGYELTQKDYLLGVKKLKNK